MANRVKEDEKNEKIIRGLQKLPANRRCINCNSLGPQYVCTNFWTFICTNCSGIHREFTHRVKSISMAKFTSQEVRALQEGGNERAKEIYFKEWDPQRHSFPDSSNIDKLRDFMKHVYVDRRYTGERRIDRPPSVKGDREDSYENRRSDPYRSGSRSPAYDETYERRYSERFGSRSPGYGSPDRFEVVDEKRRDDRTTNGSQNRIEDRRFPNGLPRPDGRSPNHQKTDVPSPPVVRPVRDILGGDVRPIQVGDPPKSNGIRAPDSSTQVQSTVYSNNRGSTDVNQVEVKTVSTGSLIDFDADPEPAVAGAPQQSVPQPPASVPANGGGWASFDVAAQQKVPQAVSSAGTLESALAQLSAPGSAVVANLSSLPVTGVESLPKANNGGQWATMHQQQPSLIPAAYVPISNPPFNAPVGAQNNQSLVSSLAPNLQGPVNALSAQSSQVVAKLPQDTGVGVPSQPVSSETKSSGRKELPVDLFTALYPPVSVPVPGWQTGPQLGMVYGMHYPNPATMPAYPQSSKSMNPFDLVGEPKLPHAATFPSLASLQGALPNVNNPSALARATSFGTPSPQWVPQQQPSYLSAGTPGPYMMHPGATNMPQQVPSTAYPVMHQGIGGTRADGAAIGLSGLDQLSAARNYHPGTPNSFTPVGGNPFG